MFENENQAEPALPGWSYQERRLEGESEPVCACDDRAGEHHEEQEQDDPATATRARSAAAKAEIILKPIEQPAQQEQLQQTTQATTAIFHL